MKRFKFCFTKNTEKIWHYTFSSSKETAIKEICFRNGILNEDVLVEETN